jgi:hypothetical protein
MFESVMVGSGLLGFLHEIEGPLKRWWKQRKRRSVLMPPAPNCANAVRSTHGTAPQ